MGTTDFNAALEAERDHYIKEGKFSKNLKSLVEMIIKHPLHSRYFGDYDSSEQKVIQAVKTGDYEVLLLVFDQMIRQEGKLSKNQRSVKLYQNRNSV